MKPGWGKTAKDYSRVGSSKQASRKGEPTPRESRLNFLERREKREREDIEALVRMGFSREEIERDLERLKSGAGTGNLARRER